MHRMARTAADVLVAVATTFAGIGWLYLLRHAGALQAGPPLREALPLQRLAGGSTQPAARVAAAWVPAGLVMGALRLRRPRRTRAVVAFAVAAVILLVVGAVSDAVTANEAIGSHLAQQTGRPVIWLAAGLMALGAVMPGGSVQARWAARPEARRSAPARPPAR